MPKVTPPCNNFNGGELSPLIEARFDINKYYNGCKIFQNAVPLVEGGAKKMPGTYFIIPTKDNGKARLVPFAFSTSQTYQLEFGDGYIRFLKNHGQIVINADDCSDYNSANAYFVGEYATLSGVFYQCIEAIAAGVSHPPPDASYWVLVTAGDPAEIVSPYALDDLLVLDVNTQSADVLYIFHSSYPPKKLIRHSHINWELANLNCTGGEPKPITGITNGKPAVVTCVGHGYPDGTVVRIVDEVGMNYINGLNFITDNATTDTFEIKYSDWTNKAFWGTYQLGGYCIGALPIFNTAGEYPGCGTLYEQRLVLAGSVNHPQRINGSVVSDYENLLQDPTQDDAAYQYDIVGGGNNKIDAIRWLIGQEELLAGTDGGVWRIFGSNGLPITSTNIDVKRSITTGAGTVYPQIINDSVIWVTRSASVVRLLLYNWQTNRWEAPDLTRVARHITKGATKALSGIIQTAFQAEPYPLLWGIRADGQLLGMTFESQEQVYAWFRIVTDGLFESLCITSQDNGEDEITVIVNRMIDGATKRYIEYFKPQEFFSQIKDCFFVHSGLTWDGGDAVDIMDITPTNPPVVTVGSWPVDGDGNDLADGDKINISEVLGMTQVNIGVDTAYTIAGSNKSALTFQLYGTDATAWTAYISGGKVKKVTNGLTNLAHLEDKEVEILIDGADMGLPKQIVEDGAVTLTYFGNKIHIGLPYRYIVEPMNPNAGSQQGTARGKKQKINRATFCFYETVGCKYGLDQNHLFNIPFGTGAAPSLFTGDITHDLQGDWLDEATISIVHDQPLPCTLKAIIPRVTVIDE